MDIENTVNQYVAGDILGQILCDDERQLLDVTDDPSWVFTLCFSLKESFFKAAFPLIGYYFDFHVVSIIGIDNMKNTIRFRLNQDLSKALPQDSEYTAYYRLIKNTLVTVVAL